MGINAMYTGMTGLDTFGNALSIVSDNVANAATTAFKSNSARFGDLVSGYLATDYSDTRYLGQAPVYVQVHGPM
jgi:flagellar hook protein FlgE